MTEKPDFGRLMKGVIPYIAVDGALKAAEFYKHAFGAVQHNPAAQTPNGRVLNITLEINGGTMMLMDPFPEVDPATKPSGALMLIVTLEGDMWWDRAIASGCEILSPLRKEFWGDRYGQLQDPFGVAWAINEPGAENLAASQQ
jgi:PhnB protein